MWVHLLTIVLPVRGQFTSVQSNGKELIWAHLDFTAVPSSWKANICEQTHTSERLTSFSHPCETTRPCCLQQHHFVAVRFLSKSSSQSSDPQMSFDNGILMLVCQSLVCGIWSCELDTCSRCFISIRLNTIIFCIQLGNVGYLLCFWHNVLFPGKAKRFRSHLFITYYPLSIRENTHWFLLPYSTSKVIIVLLKVDTKRNCDNRER